MMMMTMQCYTPLNLINFLLSTISKIFLRILKLISVNNESLCGPVLRSDIVEVEQPRFFLEC